MTFLVNGLIGAFESGRWPSGRKLNGGEDLQGGDTWLSFDGFVIQKVRGYHYK